MNIKKILVSQPRPTSEKSPYFELEKKYGVEIVFRPFIKVEGLTSKEFRQSKVNVPDYSAIILTARTAIDHFFRLCKELASARFSTASRDSWRILFPSSPSTTRKPT